MEARPRLSIVTMRHVASSCSRSIERHVVSLGRRIGGVSDRPTKINLDELEDVAPANGLGHRWEARGARQA